MKRALTAAVIGGLALLFVPQAASGSARPVTPADHSAEHQANDCAGQPEGAPDAEQEPARPYGDREQHDGDDGSELF